MGIPATGIVRSLNERVKLPTLVVGGPMFGVNGGRHLRYPNGTPLANLLLTLSHRMGVDGERFGDSTGELSEL